VEIGFSVRNPFAPFEGFSEFFPLHCQVVLCEILLLSYFPGKGCGPLVCRTPGYPGELQVGPLLAWCLHFRGTDRHTDIQTEVKSSAPSAMMSSLQ
jgi:hypothetical protein